MQIQPLAKRYVLGFVGENANGILRWWTEKILAALHVHGFESKLVDLHDPTWIAQVSQYLHEAKPHFCFSFQGMGMGVTLATGENLWTKNNIPFLSYLGDSPYHAPTLHKAVGPGMYLLYGCADFFETYTKYFGGRACASVLPCCYPENPHPNRVPWENRSHAITYVKTAVSSKALSDEWNAFPQKIRTILHETSTKVLTGVDVTLDHLCAEVFREQRIWWGDQRELFFSCCSMADRYVRAVRAERMVAALLPHDALIVGDWSHVSKDGARARFIPPVKAEDLDDLYTDSKIVVNTSPTVRYGTHERILAGLFANAAVLSDTTPFISRTIGAYPSFLGVDVDSPKLAEQVGDAIANCLGDSCMPDKVELSAAKAKERFSFDSFVEGLLEYVELERYRWAVEFWKFDIAPESRNHNKAA